MILLTNFQFRQIHTQIRHLEDTHTCILLRDDRCIRRLDAKLKIYIDTVTVPWIPNKSNYNFLIGFSVQSEAILPSLLFFFSEFGIVGILGTCTELPDEYIHDCYPVRNAQNQKFVCVTNPMILNLGGGLPERNGSGGFVLCIVHYVLVGKEIELYLDSMCNAVYTRR